MCARRRTRQVPIGLVIVAMTWVACGSSTEREERVGTGAGNAAAPTEAQPAVPQAMIAFWGACESVRGLVNRSRSGWFRPPAAMPKHSR